MATNLPYGDIFLVNTPALDRWGQQLYAEQKYREAQQRQESVALDTNIQKEIGKIRSVDTPDVINSYERYKELKKNLLFNKSLRKDPLSYNEAQQMAAKAYQDIFTTANRSAEIKDMSKNLTTDQLKNPNSFVDDFGNRMVTLMNTPVSQLTQPHPQFGDLTNWGNYMDRGINTDFGELIRKGMGQPKQVYSKEEPVEGGLQFKITPYQFGNTPLQLKDYLIGSMGMRQAGKDAAKAWDQLPEEDIANTIKQYQGLPAEYWQQMGLNGPQDLFPKNPDSKSENFASYQAMKYAISNAPKEGTPVFRTNEKAKSDLEFARKKQLMAIQHANAKELIKYKKDIDPNDQELNNIWYQSYLDKVMSEAKKDGERHHMFNPSNGKSILYYNMAKPDPFLLKSFSIGNNTPDRIGVSEAGELIPIFFKYDNKGNVTKTKDGDPVIDDDYSRPMSYEQALINVGYRGSTKTGLMKTMQQIVNPNKKYMLDGKPYTHKQLNDMGYSDDEIRTYLKSGILK